MRKNQIRICKCNLYALANGNMDPANLALTRPRKMRQELQPAFTFELSPRFAYTGMCGPQLGQWITFTKTTHAKYILSNIENGN